MQKQIFEREPGRDDDWRIRRGKLQPVYKCSRCERTHYNNFITLIRGQYFCYEHYRERRLELAYEHDERVRFPDEWSEAAICALVAKHPEWKRENEESKRSYVDRMLKVARALMAQSGVKYVSHDAKRPTDRGGLAAQVSERRIGTDAAGFFQSEDCPF